MDGAVESEKQPGTIEPAFYRIADLIRITALSRSTIYRRIVAGELPRWYRSADVRQAGDAKPCKHGSEIRRASGR